MSENIAQPSRASAQDTSPAATPLFLTEKQLWFLDTSISQMKQHEAKTPVPGRPGDHSQQGRMRELLDWGFKRNEDVEITENTVPKSEESEVLSEAAADAQSSGPSLEIHARPQITYDILEDGHSEKKIVIGTICTATHVFLGASSPLALDHREHDMDYNEKFFSGRAAWT